MLKNIRTGRVIMAILLLTLLFSILKIAGLIAWSWWLVLSPVLISYTGMFFFLLAVLVSISRDKESNGIRGRM